jgi:hypothetical protein
MPRFHRDRHTIFVRDNRKNSPTRGKTLEVTVDLTIDLRQLARELGAKAFANKSLKSKLAVGVTAEAVSERVVEL